MISGIHYVIKEKEKKLKESDKKIKESEKQEKEITKQFMAGIKKLSSLLD